MRVGQSTNSDIGITAIMNVPTAIAAIKAMPAPMRISITVGNLEPVPVRLLLAYRQDGTEEVFLGIETAQLALLPPVAIKDTFPGFSVYPIRTMTTDTNELQLPIVYRATI